MVTCPICKKPVKETDINNHLDSNCENFIDEPTSPGGGQTAPTTSAKAKASKAVDFFTPTGKRGPLVRPEDASSSQTSFSKPPPSTAPPLATTTPTLKRERDEHSSNEGPTTRQGEGSTKLMRLMGNGPSTSTSTSSTFSPATNKKAKPTNTHAPLAERMRPQSLDEVAGQELVGAGGVLRNLIVTERVPSMILWGGPGTGKTTIARLIARESGSRFVEINSASSGVAECKKIFADARNELMMGGGIGGGGGGRKTIVFCDEIHRFSKSQQDVFLAPVEAGHVTLIGATTENPSFKVVNALLSRCRTFTLSKLADEDVLGILKRALAREVPEIPTPSPSPADGDDRMEEEEDTANSSNSNSFHLLTDDDYALVRYLAAFSDGDARTGLNLLELALDLCQRPSITSDEIKKSLTQTLVYDRAGDQHYDTISAFHKSVRGGDADAALYYLARMLQSGEDPLYVARRMVVIASEDVGLADNTLLPLATATYTAAEKIGMPECRINLAHCAVALSLAPKSVRAYRGLNAAYAAIAEPGVAGLPVPVHLRNAPTKLMKELGYGKEYKYNPDYVDGKVVQDYLPEKLRGRVFLGSQDMGGEVDSDALESGEPAPGGDEVWLNPDGE